MKRILLIIPLLLSGCAVEQYAQYAKSNEAISVARSQALASIAAGSSGEAKVAAVMALALGGTGQLQAPQNEALQWASILVPGLTQVYGIRANASVAINASNNAALVANGTNAAFVGIAGQIQAPGAITTNTLSGVGTLGSGAYTTTDNHTTTPAPVVVQPVVPVTPVVITPVVTVPPVVITPITPGV